VKNTMTVTTGATGAFAMSACAGSTVAGLRPRPTHTGLEGTVVLRPSAAAAATRKRTDVPTPVSVRTGGAYG